MSSNNGTRPAKVRNRQNEQVRRNEGSPRKLDRVKVSELAKQGLSNHDIAIHQGVHPVTIWRFLKALQPQQAQLATFKERRADALAHLHGQAIEVQELVLGQMRQDLELRGNLAAMSATEKARYLHASVIAGGVAYDKERLERNYSSANFSIMSWQREAEASLFQKKGHEKKEDPPLVNGTVIP